MTGCQRRSVSLSSSKLPLCHGRGREFESRRPRHSFLVSGRSPDLFLQIGLTANDHSGRPPHFPVE